MSEVRRIRVQGIVQGVGFRPFVYGLATRANLSGFVLNDAGGVLIEAQGDPAKLDAFQGALQTDAPPLAMVEALSSETITTDDNGHTDAGDAAFAIIASQSSGARSAFVAPDVATCENCLRELFDPTDRRYRYPFINCTDCGPRYSIIRDLPYDRELTTMASFAMCDDCLNEYQDPLDRRFHAQPNACPECGPQLALIGGRVAGQAKSGIVLHRGDEALQEARRLLSAGGIVAVKGLGGYHLACDATNEEAVQRLRQAKHRAAKPLALMAASMEMVSRICHVGETEAALLCHARRPIVLLRQRQDTAVAPSVAPGQNTLGVMLPYTPLHHLLLQTGPQSPVNNRQSLIANLYSSAPALLVMTSGNRSDEPIVFDDEEARRRLGPLVDALLTHDRAIHARCDDSVMKVSGGEARFIRRSRGYAPQPLGLDFTFEEPILAVGAHQKNTFCLGKGRYAFMSSHIGDLENLETLAVLSESVNHFQRLFNVRPRIVAHDQHPDYLSTMFALSYDAVQQVGVQHHHAHIVSVMAEHGLRGPVIGVAFDGSGYGDDGTIWGGELLVADRADFQRVARLRRIPLPGGDQAIRQPWRVAAAWLQQLYGESWHDLPLAFCRRIDRGKWRVLEQMIERQINCPQTSSMGRLFDAVAALLNLRYTVEYEGQAAMELEALADEAVEDGYPFDLCWPVLEPRPMFEALLDDLRAGVPSSTIAARFHNGLVSLIVAACRRLRQEYDLNQVALSGGVFQNTLLLSRTLGNLRASGFMAHSNRRVPANDGGIALGQAVVAGARVRQGTLTPTS